MTEKLRELMTEAWANAKENGNTEDMKTWRLGAVACDMVDCDASIGALSGTTEYPDDDALLEAIEKLLPEIMTS